jgi:carboxyl-terminal processing protease
MKRVGGSSAVALVVLGAFLLGFFLTRPTEPAADVAVPKSEREKPLALSDEVRAELAREYYRWVSPEVLRERTVDGILERLGDPHTDYLTPAEFATLQERTQGSYTGVGLTVGPSREGLVVTSAFRGPARAAGIKKGDVIVRIDGKPAGRLPFERSLALIKGEKGTVVELVVNRPDAGRIRFQVIRQQIAVPPIQARLLETKRGGIAHIRVLSFSDGTGAELERATARLVEQGATGAILDLRDNPGGLLSQAVETVSVFLADGVVCQTDGAHEDYHSYRVSGEATQPDLPLVVLVNGGSASAAEIFAAALHENGRAKLVGDRTFGKASVQSIEPLSNGGALKLTTAQYVTSRGLDISEVGLRPPVKALDDPLTRADEGLAVARRVAARLIAG